MSPLTQGLNYRSACDDMTLRTTVRQTPRRLINLLFGGYERIFFTSFLSVSSKHMHYKLQYDYHYGNKYLYIINKYIINDHFYIEKLEGRTNKLID